MKTIKVLILILTLFIFPSLSYAMPITFESYLNTIDMSSKDTYQTIEIIANFKEKQNFINFSLTPRIEDLVVFLDDKEIECSIKEEIGLSVVNCQFSDYMMNKHFLKIEFNSNYPLIAVGDKLMFKSDYNPIIETKKFIYILKLPVGYIIPEERLITPKPDKIYSDGRRIILSWERKQLNEIFEISVISKSVARTFNFSYVIIVMVILFLSSAVLFYFKKIKKKEISYPALVKHEQIVVNILKKAKGNVLWQKQIQLQTGFSKVKVFRVLKSLEQRGVIKKEPWGNANKIHLVSKEPTKKKKIKNQEEK